MSRYRKFTVSETLAAVSVEVIRRLWSAGRFHNHPILQRIVDRHFDLWADWRTQITMRSVDDQTKEILTAWEENDETVEKFLYSEIIKGDTPLGGEMRLRSAFMEDQDRGDV